MRLTRLGLVAALWLGATAPGHGAETLVVDHTTPGAAFDGIMDGFPNLADHDGTGDFGGNPLSVVRKGDVTEIRSVMEFPLGPFAGIAPERIQSATLRFNVDDVLSTLGPGTELNGQAAGTILVYFYDGDGAATVADYKRISEEPVPVSTGPGVITDAKLAQSGAIAFEVDVRARLVAALGARTPFLGVLWRATDSPTGTSLDDGRGGSPSGEPSDTSAGSRMPFLTVVVGDPPPPPEPGCGNGVMEAGEGCDDGNRTSGDCCDADCAREPDGSSCDDGDACTSGDACAAGVCTGALSCGDGHLDAACGEECDDGNTTLADGCANDCRYDTLVGGSSARECYVTVAFARPARDEDGAVASDQSCTDGDPCDADPATGVCGFELAACLGRTDARTPSCAPTGALAAKRVQPRSVASLATLSNALTGLASPGCTAPVRIGVALRKKGTKPGKRKLVLAARGAGVGSDRDVVVLRCLPGR